MPAAHTRAPLPTSYRKGIISTQRTTELYEASHYQLGWGGVTMGYWLSLPLPFYYIPPRRGL